MFFTKCTNLQIILSLSLIISISEQSHENDEAREAKAAPIIENIKITFMDMFMKCIGEPLNDNRFNLENLQNFVNSESRTTVGFAPKITSNRRFFANLIGTPQFKQMLAEDEEELRKLYVRKMKYCDEVVMDQNLLKDFYDRETE